MDFNPSACFVSLATVQSSLNLYHLNPKCCSSFAYLPLIMEPVSMAKYLNMLCRSYSCNTPPVEDVHACLCAFLLFLKVTPPPQPRGSHLTWFLNFIFQTSSLLFFHSIPLIPQGGISCFLFHAFLKERGLCLLSYQ